MSTAPKDIWMSAGEAQLKLDVDVVPGMLHYCLVKPKKPKREAIAYVIRRGTKRGQGRYFYEPSEDWIDEKEHATRYCSAQHAGDTRCNGAEPFDESRTVAIVRKVKP